MAKEKNISVKRVAQRMKSEDRAARKLLGKKPTADSFQNFAAKLGMGTDNLFAQSTYGFNPVSRMRTILEWIHRGSWIGGMVIDIIAEDMTREGITLKGSLSPDDNKRIQKAATRLNLWGELADLIKWSRLYGGAIGVKMVPGQDMSTPFRAETIGRGQFKGLAVLDRWMVEPTLQSLVTEPGPHMGLPKYYIVTADAPAMRGMRIHHSRVIRMEGVRLPYWQRLMENMWGISVYERLYDRMVAFDSATTGAAQLVYKAHLRTYKIKDFREVVAAGGDAMNGLLAMVDMMRRFQSIEGMTLIDGEDDLVHFTQTAFSGLSDALIQFGQQLSGATGIPLVRLFGQSPAGLNSTGESDLRMYYDNIASRQEKDMGQDVDELYRCIALSLGIKPPSDFETEFNPLWIMDDKEKGEIAKTVTDTVQGALESGIITKRSTALKELKQSSEVTGIWTNITEDDIQEADTEEQAAPMAEELLGPLAGASGALGQSPNPIAPSNGAPGAPGSPNPPVPSKTPAKAVPATEKPIPPQGN